MASDEILTTGGDEAVEPEEIHYRIRDAIAWQARELNRTQYVSIINEGLRLLSLATLSFGDARIVAQHALSGSAGLPMYVIQRALRFVLFARRSKWDTVVPSSDNIERLVHGAKLAVSFMKVACVILSVDIDPTVKASDLFSTLLLAADDRGIVGLPKDTILVTTEEKEIADRLDIVVKDASPKCEPENHLPAPTMATPLCGWKEGEPGASRMAWKDPRECCLCHLCGDDDAGIQPGPDYDVDDADETHLGRLLPMSDGNFVHTGCALWSSEVWEDANDGLLHAVEKARSRGAQLKCFGCGLYGATVGCNKSNCLFNYHYPCAKECGAVFTANQLVFCASHKSSATGILLKENFEHMKSLMISQKKVDKELEVYEGELCTRVGSLIVHSLGHIETTVDGYHTENYIIPPGYVATRIFWSTVQPRKRTVYVLKIEKEVGESALFSITPGDSMANKITGQSVAQVYSTLLDRVRKTNADAFSHGNPLSKLPSVRRSRRKTFGLNGPQVRSH